MHANTLWRALQLRDFIAGNHTLTPWGIGLADGLERLHDHKDLHEALYLGLELLRHKFLHHEDFSVKYAGAAMHGSGISHEIWAYLDADKKHVRYICRVACLASLSKSPFPWKGPVSKSLLAFNSIVMEVSRNLRNLMEMTLLAMCAHGDAERMSRHGNDWTKLGMMHYPYKRRLMIGFLLERN